MFTILELIPACNLQLKLSFMWLIYFVTLKYENHLVQSTSARSFPSYWQILIRNVSYLLRHYIHAHSADILDTRRLQTSYRRLLKLILCISPPLYIPFTTAKNAWVWSAVGLQILEGIWKWKGTELLLCNCVKIVQISQTSVLFW